MSTVAGHGWRDRLAERCRRRRVSPLEAPLRQGRLFLLPTRFGMGWVALVILLLLVGTNYQNSLAHGLAFWLFAVGVVGLLRAWRNLLGLRLRLRLPQEVFAGGRARLGVILEAQRDRSALVLQAVETVVRVDVRGGRSEVELALPAPRRGWMAAPCLRLNSTWPLGLVRVVAWIEPDTGWLVWPRPLEEDAPSRHGGTPGLEPRDFAGLRPFTPGDRPARLAWKSWSRTGVLTTKVFDAPPRGALWLDYDADVGDPERRLSRLCGRVLAHHRAGELFGLRLPGVVLAPGAGTAHRRAALDALARFEAVPPGGSRP